MSLLQHDYPSRFNSKKLINHVSWLLQNERFSNLEMLLALPPENLFEDESLASIISLKRTYGLDHIIDMFVRQSVDPIHMSKLVKFLFKLDAENGVKILLRDSRVRLESKVLYPALIQNMPEFSYKKMEEFLLFAGLEVDQGELIRSLAAIYPKVAVNLFLNSTFQYDSIDLYTAICEGLISTGNVPLIMKLTAIAEKNNFVMGLENLYVAQIRASGKKGSFTSPAKVVRRLSETVNIQNPVLVEALMHACLDCGKLGAIIPTYHGWKKTGEPPTLAMFQAVFRVLVKEAKSTRKAVDDAARWLSRFGKISGDINERGNKQGMRFNHPQKKAHENPFAFHTKNKNFFKKEMIKYWVLPCPDTYSSLLELDYFIGHKPTFYKLWKVLFNRERDDYDHKMIYACKYGFKIMLEWSFSSDIDINPIDIWKLFPDKMFVQDSKRVLQELIASGGDKNDIELVLKNIRGLETHE